VSRYRNIYQSKNYSLLKLLFVILNPHILP